MLKNEVFKIMHERLNDALMYGFFIEAIAIEYAIVDNRLDRFLSLLTIKNDLKNFNVRFKLVKKELNKISQERKLLIDQQMSHKITNFINDRNNIIHGLLDIDYNDVYFEKVAQDGLEVVTYLQNISKKIHEITNS